MTVYLDKIDVMLSAMSSATAAQLYEALRIFDDDEKIAVLAERAENIVAADTTPWLVDIDPRPEPPVITGFGNFGTIQSPVGYLRYTTAQNDKVGWPVVLGAGTWKIILSGNQRADAGIATFKLDGTSWATIDTYASGTTDPFTFTASGLVVPVTAKYDLTIENPTKNASSSAYNLGLYWVRLVRTA